VLRVTLSYNNGSLNKRFSSHTKRGKIGYASANRCRDEVDVVAYSTEHPLPSLLPCFTWELVGLSYCGAASWLFLADLGVVWGRWGIWKAGWEEFYQTLVFCRPPWQECIGGGREGEKSSLWLSAEREGELMCRLASEWIYDYLCNDKRFQHQNEPSISRPVHLHVWSIVNFTIKWLSTNGERDAICRNYIKEETAAFNPYEPLRVIIPSHIFGLSHLIPSYHIFRTPKNPQQAELFRFRHVCMSCFLYGVMQMSWKTL